MVQFPTGWDREFAYITIHYKSRKRYTQDTTIGDARKRANAAIARKSCSWIKVAIPNADCTKSRICTWSKGLWTVDIVDLPKTKDH